MATILLQDCSLSHILNHIQLFLLIILFFHMVRVQQLFCQVTERFFQEVCVNCLDVGVVVGLTESAFFVEVVKFRPAAARELLAVMDGLAAATYATAWTCHNFHEVILHFACFDVIHQSTCIAQSTYSTSAYYSVAKLEVRFAAISIATYI